MQGKVWLIGGTSESVTLAKILVNAEVNLVVTVATQDTLLSYPDHLEVQEKRINLSQMLRFCQLQRITAIVDASHPYAVDVSQFAITVATRLNITYLRYERASLNKLRSIQSPSLITELNSFDALFDGNYLQKQRVLLTVGCKVLPRFKAWHQQASLFARILPKISSLTTALEAGFTSDRLITIRPPVSIKLEQALWQQWNISLVITKASGQAGGEDIKRQVAENLNIPLIVITRPQIFYPQKTSSVQKVLAFCQQ